MGTALHAASLQAAGFAAALANPFKDGLFGGGKAVVIGLVVCFFGGEDQEANTSKLKSNLAAPLVTDTGCLQMPLYLIWP